MKEFLLVISFVLILLTLGNARQIILKHTNGIFATEIQMKNKLSNEDTVTILQKNANMGLFENDILYKETGPRLHPQAVSFVQNYTQKNRKEFEDMRVWGKPYLDLMELILVKNRLPKELKYLAVIESGLQANAISRAKAVGPWQLMPATARLLGLCVSKKIDERTNYVRSTQAAAKYLIDLYHQFDDWLLVVAAYNCGTANVVKAIRKSNSRDFWILQYYLPEESRNHVKKFIGAHYIFEGRGGLTTLTKKEINENYGPDGNAFVRKLSFAEVQEAQTQMLSGKYNAEVIAKNIIMDLSEFNRYNPGFNRVMASADACYDLKLPAEKMNLFQAQRAHILNETVQFLLNSAVIAK